MPAIWFEIDFIIPKIGRKNHSGNIFSGVARPSKNWKPSSCATIEIKIKIINSITIAASPAPRKSRRPNQIRKFKFVFWPPPQPNGSLELFQCSATTWPMAAPKTKNGITICNVITREKVFKFINSPPRKIPAICAPKNGTAFIILINTIRPQNEIWVNGKTYPRNAAIIKIIKIIQPVAQTLCDFWAVIFKIIDLAICK